MAVNIQCSSCKGLGGTININHAGDKINHPCESCAGIGIVDSKSIQDIQIPLGVEFGIAIKYVAHPNTRIRRESWGIDIAVYLVPGSEFTVNRPPLNQILPAGTQIKHNPHLAIIDNGVVSNWLPTNEEIFATDWEVYENG